MIYWIAKWDCQEDIINIIFMHQTILLCFPKLDSIKITKYFLFNIVS